MTTAQGLQTCCARLNKTLGISSCHMKITIALLCVLSLFVFTPVRADTLHDLVGVTKNGWRIVVGCESSPCTFIIMRKKNAAGEINERQFENEHCEYTTTYKSDIAEHILSCLKSGKSPLAGTKYVGHFVWGKCRNQFSCVTGCGLDVPKILVEQLYECE